MIYVPEVVIGFLGAFMLGLGAIWSSRVRKEFEEDDELAATRLFLKGSMVSSLKVLVASSFVFGFTGALSLAGIVSGIDILANTIRVGTLVLFAGYVYLHYSMLKALRARS